MRDYIGAMRAVWRCWQEQVPLEFQSEHYDLNLMVPLFDPGPIDHPDIPIHVAVIGPNMTAMAGECADGIRLHPVVTSKYIDEEVLPNLARGAARAGRDVDAVEVCLKPLIGTAPDEERLEQVIRTVRARCAFYLSTPSYRRAFAIHGWEDRAREASSTAGPASGRRCRISSMTTCSTMKRSEPTDRRQTRALSRLDRVEFSVPVNSPEDAEAFRESWATRTKLSRSSSADLRRRSDETVSVFLDEAASLGRFPRIVVPLIAAIVDSTSASGTPTTE